MDNIDDQLAITSVYAKALYALAVDEDTVADVRAELDELAKLVQADAEFAHFLRSAAVDVDRRADSLEKIFRGKLSDLTLNTLQVMNRHGRCGLIGGLRRNVVLLDEGAHNQIECVARTARELSDEQKESVRSVAASVSKKEPLVTFEVDDSLLGGLVLEMAGWRYDNSLRRQMVELKRRLLERGDRGLPAGVATK